MFQQLLEYCKVEALYSSLLPNEASIWRSICRTYSKKFNTSLMEVLALDPEHVILNVLEDQYDATDPLENIESILDQIYAIEDPSYKKQKEEELDAFAKLAEDREVKRLLKNQNIPKKNEEKPKSGKVDFSNLNPDKEG